MTSYPTTYPGALYRPIPIHHSPGMVAPPRGMIPHVQMGRSSLFGWFSDPSSEVSSHLWLSLAGVYEQYVPFNLRAWAQGAGNSSWISVECAGTDAEDYTAAQLHRLAEFYAWGMAAFGWRPEVTDRTDGYGIGTHRMGGTAWGGHSCPGNIRANRRGDILRAAQALAAPPADPRARYAGMPLLRAGDRGPNVVLLQNALNIIFGHEAVTGDPNRLAADGDYGPRTHARVASLQRYASPWHGPIRDDGICGPDTWRKTGYILAAMHRTV